jgi:hypothetical protein
MQSNSDPKNGFENGFESDFKSDLEGAKLISFGPGMR